METNSVWLDAVVIRKWTEAVGVTGFELAPARGEFPVWRAGAHINVKVSPTIVRQYSLLQKHPNGHYVIGVLREGTSRGGSSTLVDQVTQGQWVQITEPRNNFALEPEATHTILIAGGIGITPILAMGHELMAEGRSFEIHYGSRTRRHAAFLSNVQALDGAKETSTLFEDEHGRLDLPRVLRTLAPATHVYVCGPAGLIDAVQKQAAALGWPDSQIHRESFVVLEQETSDNGAFRVTAARSGLTLEVPADRSIASVLMDAGVSVPVFCEQGVCGSCLTRVLKGRPDHRDQVLSANERDSNDQMTVCCSRALDECLVLDI